MHHAGRVDRHQDFGFHRLSLPPSNIVVSFILVLDMNYDSELTINIAVTITKTCPAENLMPFNLRAAGQFAIQISSRRVSLDFI
jgi:hypothetical protein